MTAVASREAYSFVKLFPCLISLSKHRTSVRRWASISCCFCCASGLASHSCSNQRLSVYETLLPNRIYTVSGAAWAGETDVTEIAVSTDCGQTWAEAEFLDLMRRHAWRRWKFDWLTPKEPGQYTLLARAKDASGLLQPDKHDQNYGSLRDQSLSPN